MNILTKSGLDNYPFMMMFTCWNVFSTSHRYALSCYQTHRRVNH